MGDTVRLNEEHLTCERIGEYEGRVKCRHLGSTALSGVFETTEKGTSDPFALAMRGSLCPEVAGMTYASWGGHCWKDS